MEGQPKAKAKGSPLMQPKKVQSPFVAISSLISQPKPARRPQSIFMDCIKPPGQPKRRPYGRKPGSQPKQPKPPIFIGSQAAKQGQKAEGRTYEKQASRAGRKKAYFGSQGRQPYKGTEGRPKAARKAEKRPRKPGRQAGQEGQRREGQRRAGK